MTHPAPTRQPQEPTLPRLYTVQEVAAHIRWSVKTVAKRFEREPGVLILSQKKPGKQRYRIMRIPEPVLRRVMGEWEVR